MKISEVKTAATLLLFTGIFLTAFSFESSAEEAEKKPETKPPVIVKDKAPKKSAEDYFKDARQAAVKKPGEAVYLYQQGLQMKRDDWQARRELGALAEKTGLLSLAIEQAEILNRSLATVESYRDLSNLLSKSGYSVEAALRAGEGATKFPSSSELQLLAGERHLAANRSKDSINFLQKYLVMTPDSAKALAMLGQAFEKEGRSADAYKAFSKALSLDKTLTPASEGLKRLGDRSLRGNRFILIPPDGWVTFDRGIRNFRSGHEVRILSESAGNTYEISKRLALENTPAGLFDQKISEERISAAIEHAGKEHGTKITASDAANEIVSADRYAGKITTEEIEIPFKGSLTCAVYVEAGGIENKISSCAVSAAFQAETVSFASRIPGTPESLGQMLKKLLDNLLPLQ